MKKLQYLDIGAADFKISDRWVHLKQELEPILFEPDLRSYELLKNSGYKVYNFALGSDNIKQVLNLTRKVQCSSFYIPNRLFLDRFPDKERWDIIDKITVDVKLLDDFNLDIDFIKLDTQGAELDILKGGVKTLKNVLGIEIEVSFSEIYEKQPLFGEVCNWLKKEGFEFYDFITEYRYSRIKLNRKGQLAFADALFLKDIDEVNMLSNEKKDSYITIAKAYDKVDLIKYIKI